MTKRFQLQLLHTSDVHGYVHPHDYATMKNHAMGLARIKTKMDEIASGNSIRIDTGDTIQGSPLTYYVAKQDGQPIHPMATVMNHVGYQYVTIGNHEFNYGKANLNAFLDGLDATILNCNLLHPDGTPYRGVTYDIITYDNGPRVAFIGATTHYIPNWEQPSHYADIDIRDAFAALQQTVAQIRNDVDLIVVSYHGGFERNFDTFELDVEDTGENQGSKILKDIPDIDILLTGHQHRLLHGNKFGTTYSQPGFNAQHVMELNIVGTFDDGWTFAIDTTLHDVTDVTADPVVLASIKDVEAATQIYLDTPVGHLDADYTITDQIAARIEKHPLIGFINQVQLEATNADISSCSLGNHVSGFRQELTIRDVIGTYVFPNTLVVKELTGATLKRALERTAEFFELDGDDIVVADEYNHPKLQLYAYDMYDPIAYTIDLRRPRGDRITELTLHGEPIDPDATYQVVMNNYRASGGGEYQFLRDCPTIDDTQTEVIEVLVDYIVRHPRLTLPKTTNIKIIK